MAKEAETSPTGFVHLHLHSAYSLAEGAIKIKELSGLCKKLEMPAVAVTDTINLFGALQFSVGAAKDGIQPIIGLQLFVEKPEQTDQRNKKNEMPDQLVLLAKDQQGYKNLIRLSSKSYLEPLVHAEKPAVTWEDLQKYSAGIICLTGGIKGAIGRMIIEHRQAEAEKTLKELLKIYGDRLYIELQRHGTVDEVTAEDGLLDLAYAHNVPIVATNDCFFPHPEMYEAHDTFLCIAEGSFVNDANRRRVTPEHYFKSSAQMIELFKDLPEAVENTMVIAKRCSFLLKEIKPLLPKFDAGNGKTEEEEVIDRSRKGLDWRLENYIFEDDWSPEKKNQTRKKYHERLEFELGVITKMGFSGYFLICSDFIQWAKDHDIPVGPGRGSGAASVVSWSLSITDLDPLELNLLFERMLNPERVSMPDFDIDFCQERRGEVINYVRDRYGHESVAQIATFGKLQARAVVRDCGRVMQMPYGQVDKISKLIPQNPANPVTLVQALESEQMLRDARDADEQVKKLLDTAVQLEGLYRHASTHAAGIVIGDRPLLELVPLYQDPNSDMPATQFNMKDVEPAGLVKFDFLGLKTLTVIKDAIRLIRETTGEELDPLKFPLGDEATYKMLAKGDCVAVFQLESAGMRDLCRQMNVHNFEEIIAIVALFRPGPMENIPLYIENLKDPTKIEYMHPLLEPILKDTYGVMIYQEQVMSAAQVLAGYSLGGADLLRRAMGKKIKAEMDAQREVFVTGCGKANNISPELAGSIFDMIAKFANYGFNKAHSAAYGYISFQTAYLKCHYPVEFMASNMTQDMSVTDKLAMTRQELQKMKIKLLPPDINKSIPRFSVEKLPDGTKAIRYALAALKGVGEEAMKAVVAERDKNGPFKDLYDFARRLDARVINKRQMESLAQAGAFDEFNPNRAAVLAASEIILKYAAAVAEERNSNQTSLFGGAQQSLPAPELPKADKWDPLEYLKHEFEAVGFYLSSHPLDNMATQLERLRIVPSSKVQEALMTSPSNRLRMAGIVVRKQERTSQKGNRFAFVQVSDAFGVYEVMIFSELLGQARELLEAGTLILMSVDVDKKSEDELRFLAQSIEPLTQAVQNVTNRMTIQVNTASGDVAGKIKSILSQGGQGKVKVTLFVAAGAREAEIELPGGWHIGEGTPKALRAISGVSDIREI